MLYYVYIIVSQKDGTLYTGQTNNLGKRIMRHNKGLIKSTKSKAPYQLGYFEMYDNRAQAMYREWELKKKWNTSRKKKLIDNFSKERLLEMAELVALLPS